VNQTAKSGRARPRAPRGIPRLRPGPSATTLARAEALSETRPQQTAFETWEDRSRALSPEPRALSSDDVTPAFAIRFPSGQEPQQHVPAIARGTRRAAVSLLIIGTSDQN
jgi:hypothetical protein